MSSPINNFVTSSKAKLHYSKQGSGPGILLTFHGYGQSHKHFQPLSSLNDQFTIYNFDLPHHGCSSWRRGSSIEKREIKKVFLDFFAQEGIEQFSIAAFSLGGKVMLTLLEFFPSRISSLIMIAPDGIRSNRWYRFATRNRASRWLFRTVIDRPSIYDKTTNIFRKFGVLDRSIARFVDSHMNTQEKRNQVYLVWTSYKKLRFKERQVINVLNRHRIPTYLYLGRHDRVIPERQFSRFRSAVRHLKYYSIDSGHNHLIEQVGRRVGSDIDAI